MKKFLIYFLILIPLFGCESAKEGFTLKKKNNSDEFLIEKKNPLVMPPDISDLPKPNEEKQENNEENSFQKKLKSSNSNSQNSTIESSGTLQESILKKIEE